MFIIYLEYVLYYTYYNEYFTITEKECILILYRVYLLYSTI